MSEIRCIYYVAPPDFPATDQHPDAVRYGPIERDGVTLFVDAIGGEPTEDEIAAILEPPAPPELTPAEKLAAAGLTADDLRAVLDMPLA